MDTPARATFQLAVDGDETILMHAWPETGSYLGVLRDVYEEQPVLFHCPMNADGSPDRDNAGDVENIEGLDLAAVNAFFGTAFTPDQFEGGL